MNNYFKKFLELPYNTNLTFFSRTAKLLLKKSDKKQQKISELFYNRNFLSLTYLLNNPLRL